MSARFPVRTICGSMRYAAKMMEVAQSETRNGIIVLMPFIADYANAKNPDQLKFMLDDMHKVKIDMADAIVVVGLHIGDSTKSEIDYATQTGKTILYWTDHFGAQP